MPVSDHVSDEQEVEKPVTNVKKEFNLFALALTDLKVKDTDLEIDLGFSEGNYRIKEIHSATKIMMPMLFSQGVTFSKDNADIYKKASSNKADSYLIERAIVKYCVEHSLRQKLSEKYKKYMVSEENAIQAFGLALEEIATENKLLKRRRLIGPQMWKTFLGCKFDDQDYTYSMTDASRWGKHPLPPMIFKTFEKFQDFHRTLAEACSSVIKENNLNNLDQLIR